MSDHEFEKQVQQKLGGLKLRPADTVWAEVEKEIRRTKRRRRIALWLPLLFLVLCTSGYMLYTTLFTPNEAGHIAQTAPSVPSSSSSSTNDTPIADNTTHNTTSTTEQIKEPYPVKENSNQPVTDQPPAMQQQPNTPEQLTNRRPYEQPAQQRAIVQKEMPVLHKRAQQRNYKARNSNVTVNDLSEVFPVSPKDQLHTNKEVAGRPAIQGNPVYRQEASLPAEDERAFSMPARVHNEYTGIATDRAMTDMPGNKKNSLFTADHPATAATAPLRRQRAPRWQLGMQAHGGFSRISQNSLFELKGLLGQEKYATEDLAATVDRMPNVPGTSSVFNVAPAVNKPSPIQIGKSFSAGIFVQRPLSKRLRFSVGLQYSYSSARTMVGRLIQIPILVNIGTSRAQLVDEHYLSVGPKDSSSTLNGNLQTSSGNISISQQYTYNFHYIELPVMLHWQMNKGRRMLPLVLDGGISVARLISVDALHYDGTKGVYYKNNDLFNRTSVNALLGLNIGIFQNTKHPVWIGPTLRYSLTGLVNKDVSSGQYLWSTGISVKMLLKK